MLGPAKNINLQKNWEIARFGKKTSPSNQILGRSKGHFEDVDFLDRVQCLYSGKGPDGYGVDFGQIERAFFEYLGFLGNKGFKFRGDRHDLDQVCQILNSEFNRQDRRPTHTAA